MKKFVVHLILACLVLLSVHAPLVQAQLDCPEQDVLAFVFENGDINFNAVVPSPIYVQVVLLNPTWDCVSGFEFSFQHPTNCILLGTTFPVDAINVGDQNNMIVGYATPNQAIDDRILLCTIQLFVIDPSPGDFFVGPPEPASIEGQMAYANCDWDLIPMDPISQDFSLPVARINGTSDLIYCGPNSEYDFSVQISALGDANNFAGVAMGASDDFDLDFDQFEVVPDPRVFFPHPEWNAPGGDNFSHDIKAPYDPLTNIKQWTFVVDAEIESSGSAPLDVNVSFQPAFADSAFVRMKLIDHTAGSATELMPPYVYSYQVDSSDYRTFDLIIGREVNTNWDLLVDLHCNDLSDTGNRAATASGATDGFDPGFDIPAPGPPPSQYLVGKFYHSDWPLGPRFLSDVRAPFDPLTGAKTWPFRVETDQSGTVVLDFTPSFDEYSDNILMLKDLTTGQTYSLFPNLTYSFENYGTPTHRDFEITVGGATIQVPPLYPTSRQLLPGWSLIGFPLNPPPGQETLNDVILDPMPGYGYLFNYGGDTGYVLQTGNEMVEAGDGYWVATVAGYNWTMPGNISPDPVDVPLRDGWNLVGNPLWFPAPLEGVLVKYEGNTYGWSGAVNAGLVSGAVMVYNTQNDNYYTTLDLMPWEGYWFAALAEGISLTFDWERFMAMPLRMTDPPALKAPSGSNWRTDFAVTNSADQTRLVTFGETPEARLEFDAALDMPLPPASPAGGIRLGIMNPEWDLSCGSLFASDFIQYGEDPVHWNIEIKDEEAGEVTLSWINFDWPEGMDFQLYLPNRNRVVVLSMREQSSITLPVEKSGLVVQVRTPDMMSATGDLPDRQYRLGVSPNPFNPQTTIFFNLVEPGDVELKIYSIRGELVQSLTADGLEAGGHEMVWRGRDRSGRTMPSGSYFVRLYRNGSPVGVVAKMSLIR
jgi:FlgD Ig-like domain